MATTLRVTHNVGLNDRGKARCVELDEPSGMATCMKDMAC
jgi:hypothetical protein